MTAPDAEFLRQEYFQLQEAIEKFDEKALTIKAWSVTISMAGIGAAFTETVPILLLLSAVASMLFWVTEALWKTFQQSHYPRIYEIETLMAGLPVDHPTSPLIATSWAEAWRTRGKLRYLLAVLTWPHVFLPHVVVLVGGFAVWLANLRLHFLTP